MFKNVRFSGHSTSPPPTLSIRSVAFLLQFFKNSITESLQLARFVIGKGSGFCQYATQPKTNCPVSDNKSRLGCIKFNEK